MKINFRSVLLSAGLLSFALLAPAQKDKKATTTGKSFEGTVVFTIDLNGDGLPPEAKAMYAGSEMTVCMKGDKSRTDVKMGPQATTTIADAKTKEVFTLMDMMGTKYKINGKIEGGKTGDPTVKELPDTKEIAGYKCKKAEVTPAGGGDVITVYYTEQIANNGYNTQVKGIKGYPLEFEMTQGGVKVSYAAKSVSTDKVLDSKFVVDTTGYKEITAEELMKSMGGH